jgi:hypothetical protein
MKASVFVCASALLFASWLGVTYLREVPSKDYPNLGSGSVPVSARKESPAPSKEALISLDAKTASDMAKVK